LGVSNHSSSDQGFESDPSLSHINLVLYLGTFLLEISLIAWLVFYTVIILTLPRHITTISEAYSEPADGDFRFPRHLPNFLI